MKTDQTFQEWIVDGSIVHTSINKYFEIPQKKSLVETMRDQARNNRLTYLKARPTFNTTQFDELVIYAYYPAQQPEQELQLSLYPINSESVRKLRALDIPDQVFDAIPDFMVICSPDFTIQRVNAAATWVFGAGINLEGKKCYKILRGKESPCDDCPLPETLQNNEVIPLEYYDTERGEFFELRTYPYKDDNELLQGFTIIDRLISLRQKEEMELTRDKKLQALGRMASGIVHDFNNMLAVVLGKVQMLGQKIQNHAFAKELQTIEKAVEASIDTIRRLQDFTRDREEVTDQTFQPVSINTIVKEVIDYSKTRSDRMKQEHGFQIIFEERLNDVPTIIGDNVALRNALVNIVFNSIDSLEVGGVISIWTDQVRGQIELGVSDTGIGMTKEVMEKIFDPFFTTKKQKGTGLGLSEVYGIVKHHNGKIEVDSTPGEGTTITVYFPITEND